MVDLGALQKSKDELTAEDMLQMARAYPWLRHPMTVNLSRNIGPDVFSELQRTLADREMTSTEEVLLWLSRVTARDDLRPRGQWKPGKWDGEIAYWRSLSYPEFKKMIQER